MQGILIVDKPAGFTSFDVIAKLRGICNTRKIGHSGTLDPMATGVLPVFIGNAAKAVDMQTNTDKTYEAVLLLGKRTDTGDITGETLETADVPDSITCELLQATLPQFLGNQMQLPPMYSAVKINGQPLYKAARRGETVERKARPITIHNIELLQQLSANEYRLRISCGKGTYVRVLLEDIGKALGLPATMSALRRTVSGVYQESQAIGFAQIQALKEDNKLESALLCVETVFETLPVLTVNEAAYHRLLNGAVVYRVFMPDGEYRLHYNGTFLGLGTVSEQNLNVKKLFLERN